MKMNDTNKVPYISPEVIVIHFSSEDIMAASGNDGYDNWIDDDFTI